MLSIGSRGNFVRQWQSFLSSAGHPCGKADGIFGDATKVATQSFQQGAGLGIDGRVGTDTFRAALATTLWPAPEGYPLILCTYHTPATRGDAENPINYVVLHDMEVPEAKGMAIEIAGRFALETSPKASAHFHVDDREIIQGCLLEDVAWHASSGNRYGIGIEHAGFASQRPAEWDDDYSRAELSLSAQLSADLCKRYGIPIAWVDATGLKAGKRGITDHATINDAFLGVGKGHRDPGEGFDRDGYVALVSNVLL